MANKKEWNDPANIYETGFVIKGMTCAIPEIMKTDSLKITGKKEKGVEYGGIVLSTELMKGIISSFRVSDNRGR